VSIKLNVKRTYELESSQYLDVSVLATAHFLKERKYMKDCKNECKVFLPSRFLSALEHIVKHIAYGGHSW